MPGTKKEAFCDLYLKHRYKNALIESLTENSFQAIRFERILVVIASYSLAAFIIIISAGYSKAILSKRVNLM